jgi:hypothetical protein
MKRAALILFFAAFLPAVPASAADAGDVALVEDVNGKIKTALNNPMDLFQQYAACEFYNTHDDIYDAIFVFTTYHVISMFATPSGYPVNVATKGVGRDLAINKSTYYCSKNSRLKHAVKMGDLSYMPANPDDMNLLNNGVPYSGIEVLGHEMGHYWLAMADFSQAGTRHCLIRGFMGPGGDGNCDGHQLSDFGVHWSFLFNNPSLMFGSRIDDLGGGNFRITGTHPKFSPLDQYLMGIRSKESVPAMFVVKTMYLEEGSTYPLAAGDTLDIPQEFTFKEPQRWDLTINDIVAALGERVPQTDPCHWKAAFILVYPEGPEPTPQQIAKVEAYRQRWETFYPWATDNRGSVDTTLDGHGTGTAGCKGQPTYPDGGAPDSGTDAGQADGAVTDGGKADAGMPDGGKADGGSADGGVEADSGLADDGGPGVSDGSVPVPDGGGLPDGAGAAEIDVAAGCSCSKMGLEGR